MSVNISATVDRAYRVRGTAPPFLGFLPEGSAVDFFSGIWGLSTAYVGQLISRSGSGSSSIAQHSGSPSLRKSLKTTTNIKVPTTLRV